MFLSWTILTKIALVSIQIYQKGGRFAAAKGKNRQDTVGNDVFPGEKDTRLNIMHKVRTKCLSNPTISKFGKSRYNTGTKAEQSAR